MQRSLQTNVRRLAMLASLAAMPYLSTAPRYAFAWSLDDIEDLVIFGDSASDTGNVFSLTGGAIPAEPYFEGRFSDGPIWVDRLAERLGLPTPEPSDTGGTNYAFGGAQTGPGFSPTACAFVDGTRTCVPNIGTQIDRFINGDGATNKRLFIVQGGYNNPSARLAAVQLAEHVATLAAEGAEYFLVPNLANIAQDPAKVHGDRHWIRFQTDFNRILEEELSKITGVTIVPLDFALLSELMIGDPLGPEGDYAFTNITDPACPGCNFQGRDPGPIAENPNEYLYWDQVHYTAEANRILGDFAFDQMQQFVALSAARRVGAGQPIPEQSSLCLALAAVALAGVIVRR